MTNTISEPDNILKFYLYITIQCMNQSSIKNGLIYAVIRHDAINCITAIS